MFTGEYNHTIDAKGRIIVPSKLREELGESFYITRGLDGCLFVYPNSEFEIMTEKLNNIPGTRENRKLERMITGCARQCEIDKQGRVLIPLEHRQFANLDKDVVFVGVNRKIEIWSKEKWDEFNDFSDIDDLAESLAELGLKL